MHTPSVFFRENPRWAWPSPWIMVQCREMHHLIGRSGEGGDMRRMMGGGSGDRFLEITGTEKREPDRTSNKRSLLISLFNYFCYLTQQ